MNITMSDHASKQTAMRGISEGGVRAILEKAPFIASPSKYDPNVVVVFGIYVDRVWAIVFNYLTQVVVTVRPASRKERAFYGQHARS